MQPCTCNLCISTPHHLLARSHPWRREYCDSPKNPTRWPTLVNGVWALMNPTTLHEPEARRSVRSSYCVEPAYTPECTGSRRPDGPCFCFTLRDRCHARMQCSRPHNEPIGTSTYRQRVCGEGKGEGIDLTRDPRIPADPTRIQHEWTERDRQSSGWRSGRSQLVLRQRQRRRIGASTRPHRSRIRQVVHFVKARERATGPYPPNPRGSSNLVGHLGQCDIQ